MTYVMEMTTDQDIIATGVNTAWNPITARYHWNQVQASNLDINNPATIIVIAHGNRNEIGNDTPNTGVDITAAAF